MSLDPVVGELKEIRAGLDAKFKSMAEDQRKSAARILDLEQMVALGESIGRGMGGSIKSAGELVAESEEIAAFVKSGAVGRCRIPIESKSILNLGTIVQPDRQSEIVQAIKRRLRIRDLLAPGRTQSNSIQWLRQSSESNVAATVAEGALKPQSDLGLQLMTSPVSTIATYFRASRQSLDDLSQLQSLIDGRGRYMLGVVEETQMLTGDGTGVNLSGLLLPANSTAYDTTRTVSGDTKVDTLLNAVAQVQDQTFLEATGIVVNNSDWTKIRKLKTAQGAYLIGDPQEATEPNIWGVPVVTTPAMAAGSFLVGNFNLAAQIFDRLDAEVLVSTEDQDNFVRNLVTIRCEERLAMVVSQPLALVYGAFPT